MNNPLVSIVVVTHNRKKDLINCVQSFFVSSYRNCELVIVDNNSSEKVIETWWKKKHFPLVIVRVNSNSGAAEGRNIGFLKSKGEYILFMDDDAIADKNMIESLLAILKKPNYHAGIVQPLIYDKEKPTEFQGAGHGINLWTGRLHAWGVREKDSGQYNTLRNIPMAGCIWMVKRKVFDTIGLYDKEYFIPYEDTDFSIRARKAGFEVYCVPEAKAWHLGKKSTFVHPLVEYIGITSPERAYRVTRNKLIFMRKHASLRFIPFFIFFLPIYVILHTIFIAVSNRFDILFQYWKGLFSGILYSLIYPYKK